MCRVQGFFFSFCWQFVNGVKRPHFQEAVQCIRRLDFCFKTPPYSCHIIETYHSSRSPAMSFALCHSTIDALVCARTHTHTHTQTYLIIITRGNFFLYNNGPNERMNTENFIMKLFPILMCYITRAICNALKMQLTSSKRRTHNDLFVVDELMVIQFEMMFLAQRKTGQK